MMPKSASMRSAPWPIARTQLDGVDSALFVGALSDPSPRVRAQALIAIGRLGDVAEAPSIVPLTSRPEGSAMPTARPVHAQPDPDRAVPHLAMRALVSLRAVDACLDAVDGPHGEGALRALRSMHEPRAVDGLIKKLAATGSPEIRRGILATLIRIYHREADYDGSWWGIRPDTSGPYYDPREWECSDRIASVLKVAVLDGDPTTVAFLRDELDRHRVRLEGLPANVADRARPHSEEEVRVVIAKADPNNPDQIGNLTYEAAAGRALRAKGDADARQGALRRPVVPGLPHRCRRPDAQGAASRGHRPARTAPPELVESILRPSAKIAQGYESYSFAMVDGQIVNGFVVGEGHATVRVRESTGALRELKRGDIEERRRQESSAMPEGIAGTLTPEQLNDLIAYLQSLDSNPIIRTDP